MDKLCLHGLELWLRVGCTPEERSYPQRVFLDAWMELPLQTAGTKDDVKETVDYADLVNRLKKTLEPKVYHLIEAVAEDASQLILREKKIRRVTLRVRKQALAGLESASVEVQRPSRREGEGEALRGGEV